jgi:hypothetical protein
VWAYSGSSVAHYDGHKWTSASLVKLFPAATAGQPVAPALTGILALGAGNVYATGVGWGSVGVGGGAAVVLHYNGHAWSRVAAGQNVINGGFVTLASDGKGGLWFTADTHQNQQQLLHYSAGKLTNAGEPFTSVASIPGTAGELGGNATGVATQPVVYQYS